MRRPETIERLYLDFDGFFASVEQLAKPELCGCPVGVIPFDRKDGRGILIACSREAKQAGIKNVMDVREALTLCRDLVLVPQSPDLYRRVHNALISEISAIIPIDAIKSIDELTCTLDSDDRHNPLALGHRIKRRIRDNIGPAITCSIGYAANRQLAKMACKAGKWVDDRYGDGNCAWHPKDMPLPLLALNLEDVPGIGSHMAKRLRRASVLSVADLMATQPKQMRTLWHNVNGERLWYALHGFDIQISPSSRRMYGHGRVLPPDHRSLAEARSASRLLLVKAARRMRREGWNAKYLNLWLNIMHGNSWSHEIDLAEVHDDQAVLAALEILWTKALRDLPRSARALSVGVTFSGLTNTSERQLDMLRDNDETRNDWVSVTRAMDALNRKYGRTLVSVGPWTPPPGGYAGGKISYTRVPAAEDFF